MFSFTNISTYQFAALSDLKSLRAKLLNRCRDWEIKGTILLSTEGINLFVAGRPKVIDLLCQELRQIPGLESLKVKISESREQPFRRMLVRIKKEIIAFGVEGIDPSKHTSAKLSPRELKQWLDEGREITLLDTRNDYEIKLGTFENALPIGIKHFREFPKGVSLLPEKLRQTPVVMFCTGGIRCEKAGPYLESQGFEKVFQLEGGILKYFEECGNAHYQGDCFVFDQRVGLDPSLQETANAQCFACLTPLTVEEQQDGRYQKGKSCPYCFKTTEQKMRASIAARQRTIVELMTPLPGSTPYVHQRPLSVPARHQGLAVADFMSTILSHITKEAWLSEITEQRLLGPDREPVSPERLVKAGERYYHLTPTQSEPEVNAQVTIRYEDEALVVLEKPAPLPVHACGRFNRNTLSYLLAQIYAPQKPLPAHRLDANTTGLMLIARTRHFAGLLQPQFSRGEIEKKYWAKVHGHPAEDLFVCELALGETTHKVGARFAAENGLRAKTEFKVLNRFSDGTSLLEVRPITGRTNQIRIHLWELGFPIVGEQLYLPNRRLGEVQTVDLDDSPLCLTAQSITFTHPITRVRMSFEVAKVEWATCQ